MHLIRSILIASVACAALFLAPTARANTYYITCDGVTPDQLVNAMTGNGGFTGTFTQNPTPSSGDSVVITGLCVTENDSVGDSWGSEGVTFFNHNETPGSSGSYALSSTDGIEGIVEPPNGTKFIGLTFKGLSSDSVNTPADVQIDTAQSVQFLDCAITNAQRDGIVVLPTGTLLLDASTVSGNGIAEVSGFDGGIHVLNGGAFLGIQNLDQINTALGNTISGNYGYGILAEQDSAVRVVGGMIGGTTTLADGITEIAIKTGSSLKLIDATVTGSSSSTHPVVQIAHDSTASLRGSTISGTGSGQAPVVEASASSSIALAGGNTIDATASSGTAIEVDHSSSLTQPIPDGLTSDTAAIDTVIGAGAVVIQSSMDLGQGLVSSSPGLNWTGSISVTQNSSFRLSGGTSITGAVSLLQGSNGFFNKTNGGNNAVSSGVTCSYSTDADSHVSGPSNVTPAVSTVASTPKNAAPTSPACLLF